MILTDPEVIETWLTAPLSEVSQLRRPLPDVALQIVARGGKKDGTTEIRAAA